MVEVAIKSNSGIDIAGNVSVLNDVRASGALILAIAVLTILGAFARKLTFTSSLVSSLLFISLGIGRAVSMLTDGMPVDGLVKATGLEFVLGLIGAFLFIRFQEK